MKNFKKKQTVDELKQEGLVKNASELVGTEGILAQMKNNPPRSYEDSRDEFNAMFLIGMDISRYCGELGILPSDLIETHRQSLKMPKTGKKDGKESKIQEKPPRSNWFKDYKKQKTGISE